MDEEINDGHRDNVTRAIVENLLNNSDSIHHCSKQLLICAMNAGLRCSDLERAIAWWRLQ